MSALSEAIRRSFDAGGAAGDASPMRVLGRRQLSGYEVFAQSVATTAPAASMVIVPTMLLSSQHPVRELLILMLVVAATVLAASCLTQFTRRMVSPGGIYSFLFQGLGSRGALLGGTAILVKYLASASMTLYHGSMAMDGILGSIGIGGSTGSRVAVCLAIAVAMIAALIRGAKVAAMVILGIELTSLVFIVGLMLSTTGPQNLDVTGGAGPTTLPFWLVAVFALAGFESATFLGSEAKRPYVSVTRAVLWTPVLCGSLFLLAGWAALTGRADGIVDAYLTGSTAAFGTVTVTLLQVALMFSWLASAMASSNAASRILFSMGVDRVLPRVLSAVHTRFRTPIAGIGTTIAAVAGVSVCLALGASSVALPHIQPVARVGIMIVYFLVAVAAVTFLRRIGELTTTVRLSCVVVAVAAVIGLVGLIAVDARWRSLTVGLTVIVLVVGTHCWARWLDRYAADRAVMMGAFDRADSDDVLPGAAIYGRDESGALVLVAKTDHIPPP